MKLNDDEGKIINPFIVSAEQLRFATLYVNLADQWLRSGAFSKSLQNMSHGDCFDLALSATSDTKSPFADAGIGNPQCTRRACDGGVHCIDGYAVAVRLKDRKIAWLWLDSTNVYSRIKLPEVNRTRADVRPKVDGQE